MAKKAFGANCCSRSTKRNTVELLSNVPPTNGPLPYTAIFQFTEFFFNKFLPTDDQLPQSDLRPPLDCICRGNKHSVATFNRFQLFFPYIWERSGHVSATTRAQACSGGAVRHLPINAISLAGTRGRAPVSAVKRHLSNNSSRPLEASIGCRTRNTRSHSEILSPVGQ